MSPAQDLDVQQKRELERKGESTIPARVFVPTLTSSRQRMLSPL